MGVLVSMHLGNGTAMASIAVPEESVVHNTIPAFIESIGIFGLGKRLRPIPIHSEYAQPSSLMEQLVDLTCTACYADKQTVPLGTITDNRVAFLLLYCRLLPAKSEEQALILFGHNFPAIGNIVFGGTRH